MHSSNLLIIIIIINEKRSFLALCRFLLYRCKRCC